MAANVDQKLRALRELDVYAADAPKKLREALASPHWRLVEAAAALVGEHLLSALAPDLASAFERMIEGGAKRDPGCRVKIAIAQALSALGHWDDRVFVAGLSCVQREGWAGQEPGAKPADTAAELRGVCAQAHVVYLRDDALDVCAGLLADEDHVARVAAARALGDGGRGASAVLRYKVLTGDKELEVLASCIESLLHIDRAAHADFVIALLARHDERAEVAAVALGGARVAEAFEPLRVWCIGSPTPQRQRFGYLALALLRSEPATVYLLDAIRSNGPADALAAARALATFKDDPALVARVREAAAARSDADVGRQIAALVHS